MEENKNELVKREPANLATPTEELEYRIMTETDLEEIKHLITLFNFDIQKRNILRTGKLNGLQDKIYDQIDKRIDKRPDEFSNKDLLDYFKAVQDTLNKTDLSLDKVDSNNIQITQQNLNINLDNPDSQLSQASKQKVMEAVRNILKQAELKNSEPEEKDLTNEATSDIIIDAEFDEVQEDN